MDGMAAEVSRPAFAISENHHGSVLFRYDNGKLGLAILQTSTGDTVALVRSEAEYIQAQELARLHEREAQRVRDSASKVAEAEFAKREAATQAEERRRRQAAVAAAAAARERTIRSKRWPSRFTEAVLERRVMIGMTAEMVRLAWGPPETINSTITAAGEREQWVYGLGSYVYLVGSVVTAIQTSR
jgi:multidrug efflux pump subunit AcrA (membrane-fusion protein)